MDVSDIDSSGQVLSEDIYNMKHRVCSIISNIQFLRVRYHWGYVPISSEVEYSICLSQAFN